MKAAFEEIIRLEKEYADLTKKQFTNEGNSINKQNIRHYLDNCCDELRNVALSVSNLMEAHVFPYLRNPEIITPKIAEDLDEFADALSGYSSRLDTGLSHEIRVALTSYALIIDDEEFYIKNLFFTGLCLFFLNKELFNEKMLECYLKITAFAPKYKQFDKTTRNFIVRAFGNCYVSIPYENIDKFFFYIDKALYFWKNTAEKVDPDFNWSAFYNNVDDNICSIGISYIRNNPNGVQSIDKKIISRLYSSSKKLYEAALISDPTFSGSAFRVEYFYSSAQYYSGFINEKEYLEVLYNIYSSTKDNDYGSANIFRRLQISAIYLLYLSKSRIAEYDEDFIKNKIYEIEQNTYKFVLNIPNDVPQNLVTQFLANFSIGMYMAGDELNYLRIVLNLTVFRHKPTFVHSVMVAKISGLIMRNIIKNHPEKLTYITGLDTIDKVQANAHILENFIWYAGISHDIGKIAYSNMVAIYVRRLHDCEFEIIKKHPNSILSDKFSNSDHDHDENNSHPNDFLVDVLASNVKDREKNNIMTNDKKVIDCIAKIAYGHHKSHDEKTGYPVDWSNVKHGVRDFTDIVTIADCIDAATDSVGRSYAHGKTLEVLLEEFEADKGTKYSPFVVDLLKSDTELMKQIQNAIDEFRYDTYYSCLNLYELSSELFEPNI